MPRRNGQFNRAPAQYRAAGPGFLFRAVCCTNRLHRRIRDEIGINFTPASRFQSGGKGVYLLRGVVVRMAMLDAALDDLVDTIATLMHLCRNSPSDDIR